MCGGEVLSREEDAVQELPVVTFNYNGETITLIGRNHFLVESKTCPGEHHAVDGEEETCSCKGFQCLKYCRHLTSLKGLFSSHKPETN